MFTDFKAQFLWCIMCTFLTGMIFGILFSFIERGEHSSVFSIIAIFSLIFTIGYWYIIFKQLKAKDRRMDLERRINSVYTDID